MMFYSRHSISDHYSIEFIDTKQCIFSYIWKDSDLDDEKEKKWTWVLVFLSVWPQYQALKLVKRIFKLQRAGIYCDKEDLKRQGQVRYSKKSPRLIDLNNIYKYCMLDNNNTYNILGRKSGRLFRKSSTIFSTYGSCNIQRGTTPLRHERRAKNVCRKCQLRKCNMW